MATAQAFVYTEIRVKRLYTKNRIKRVDTDFRILKIYTLNRISWADVGELPMPDQIARTPKHIGEAVRRRRRALSMTQKDAAGKTGLRQATISELEAGEAGTLRTLFDVLAALDMELVVRPRTKGSMDNIEDLF